MELTVPVQDGTAMFCRLSCFELRPMGGARLQPILGPLGKATDIPPLLAIEPPLSPESVVVPDALDPLVADPLALDPELVAPEELPLAAAPLDSLTVPEAEAPDAPPLDEPPLAPLPEIAPVLALPPLAPTFVMGAAELLHAMNAAAIHHPCFVQLIDHKPFRSRGIEHEGRQGSSALTACQGCDRKPLCSVKRKLQCGCAQKGYRC